jgi:hypothetical protein
MTSDGRLVVYGLSGKIGLIAGAQESPKKFKELSVRNRIFQATAWPHIAVGARCVVCRDKDGNLACFATAAHNGPEK